MDKKINVKQICLKVSSKKEVYRMLQLEGNVYLPPPTETNHNYISKLISGKKKVSRHDN